MGVIQVSRKHTIPNNRTSIVLNKPYFYFFLFLIIASCLAGCSAERHNPLSRAYQNTTAHYNAFFLGNERLKELEAGVAAKAIPDYNRVLPIFPYIDSVTASGYKKELEEIIKKASHPIQKHPTSDWTDNSYLLIGKARFYGLEYDDAIKTFKYVNSTSTNEVTRHEALLWLMRSFVTVEDLESARAVSDIMKKQFLTKENATLLFLTRAQYYLLLRDTKLAIENLKLAIPLVEPKDEEARIRFILGQLYQQTGQDQLAYQQFSRIIRKTPPYELGFQSKLYLGQVTTLSNAADKEKIDRYFRKLQKDAKNLEYRDKIFYEMARFELKQNKPEQALNYLNQSVRASKNNPGQKGYGYLLAGQIYYDKLQNYPLAYAYYDSAVQVLPPTAADYTASAERRDILKDFATNYTVVVREDSLQALANLSPGDRDRKIAEIIALAEAQKEEEARKAAYAAAQATANPSTNNQLNQNSFNTTNNTGARPATNTAPAATNVLWYFDNPATIGSAKAEFVRRWGNRTLQDNWRITTQQVNNSPQDVLASNNVDSSTQTNQDATAQQEAFRLDLVKDIPLTPAQRAASDKRIEDGLFALATIYRERLKEPARAIETYEKLLARFPQTKYAPETYYTLYLLYKDANDPKQTTYANLTKQRFPNTRYAKLIDQPDYLVQVSAGNAKVRQLYDSAYALYNKQKYVPASNMLNTIRKEYPDSDQSDKIDFLNVLLIGQTEQPSVFKLALQQFVSRHANSPLAEKARQYLGSFSLYESGKLSEAEFDKTHPKQLVAANQITEQPAPNPVPGPTPTNSATTTNKPVTTPETPVKDTPAPVQKAVPTKTPPVTNKQPDTNTVAKPANGTNAVANPEPAAPPAATQPAFAIINIQAPQMVVIAYPKGHAAFADVISMVQGYNNKYNGADQLTVETTVFNPTTEFVVIREFSNAKKAKIYTSKQKSPQSPLSKIRGTKFDTFVISSENLPVLLQNNNLEEYLTFYKNNY